ncbi:MAG: O-antigen polymerase [Polaromonas sp.]|nr:O-antigen polymerase [Polaromonas sp.]
MAGTLFLILPWLNPYTAGPTPNAWPLLLSALCAVVLWFSHQALNPKLISTAWITAAAASVLIALVQYFGFASTLNPWISQTAGEAFANLRQRNQFATLTSIGLLALIGWLGLQAREHQHLQAWRVPGWAFALAVLLALGNAASNSRTGLLQWGLIAVLTAWWTLPGRWRLLVFALQALLAYGVAVFALPLLLEWVTGQQSGGLFGRLVGEIPVCASRKALWSNVLTLIGQKPWGGWGWGELDYAHFITLYPGPRFCEILDNAHNLPLHLAVELGVPAALAVCGGLGWMVWRGKPWQEQNPARQMAWGVLAVIGLHSLLEYPLWYGPFQIAVGLSAWLLLARPGAAQAQRPGQDDKHSRNNQRFAPYVQGFTAMALIAMLAAVAMDYQRVSQIYLPPEKRSAAYRDDTLAKVRDTWLFQAQARFAELSITPLTPGNAAALHDMATQLLHYSPEPRVVEKVIESAVMLGRNDEALFYLVRYRAAFPKEHARWVEGNALAGAIPGTKLKPF